MGRYDKSTWAGCEVKQVGVLSLKQDHSQHTEAPLERVTVCNTTPPGRVIADDDRVYPLWW